MKQNILPVKSLSPALSKPAYPYAMSVQLNAYGYVFVFAIKKGGAVSFAFRMTKLVWSVSCCR